MTPGNDVTTARPLTRPPAGSLARIVVIDSLRGLALVAMASYHFIWDLEFFGYLDAGTATQGGFRLYARAIAASFLFLAGASLVLAHTPAIRWQPFLKRLAIVAAAALTISLATYFATPQEWIHFGILHNIALSSVIGLAFLRLPAWAAGAAALAIIAAVAVNAHIVPGALTAPAFDSRWLSWTGFAQTPPRSNDYVPLIPWLAALLFGIGAARLAQTKGWLPRLAALQTKPNLLSRAGRNSLAVYLIHQPVLIALVYLATLIIPPPQPDPRPGYISGCENACLEQTGDAQLCRHFCVCTADRLTAQSLMLPLQSGAVTGDDPRIQALAQECSIAAGP